MNLTVNITLVIVVVAVAGIGAYEIGSYLIGLATQPQVTMTFLGSYSGTCTPTYWLFFQTGWTRPITANFTVRNTGPSNGQVTITFTEDGSQASQHDFFIGSGKTETMSYQFSIGDCSPHQFGAYISGVKQA